MPYIFKNILKHFRFLPVEVDNKIMYQVPGTVDLVDSAPEVTCTNREHFIVKTADGRYM